MTRKTFAKSLLALLCPLTLFGAKKKDIWATPQGQYVKMLNEQLAEFGLLDDIYEDRQLTEMALADGHKFFTPLVSRQTERDGKTFLLRTVRPINYFLGNHKTFDNEEIIFLDSKILIR